MKTPNLELAEVSLLSTPEAPIINEAYWALDTLVQPAVLSRSVTAPPGSASQGVKYIVPAGATGEWAGRTRHVAYLTPDGWKFRVPRPGWRFNVLDETNVDVVYSGTEWLIAWGGLPAGASAGQVLGWDGTKWGPTTPSGGGAGGNNIDPDTHPLIVDLYSDEFETGSGIDTAGTRVVGAAPWVPFNIGTTTTSIAQGSLVVRPTLTAASNQTGYSQAHTGPFTVTCKLSVARGNSSSLTGMMVCTASGAAGKSMILGVSNNNALVVQKRNSSSSFGSNPVLSVAVPTFAGFGSVPAYYRISYDGTTLIFSVSASGVEGSFVPAFTEAAATFLGTPGGIGISSECGSASVQSVAVYDWWRRT